MKINGVVNNLRLNVGVVFGGKSVEHEVSIITALQMIENMNKLKFNPITVYLSKDNVFYYHERMTDISYFHDLQKVKEEAKRVIFNRRENNHELLEIKGKRINKLFDIDLVFIIMHGANCEDGTISAYFDLLNIPYVGSSLLSSAINQNKWKMKALLDYHHIPVVPYYGFYESDFYQDEKSVIENCERMGYPLIVKPATLGSSVGIQKCRNREELYQGIITALQYDTEVLVEIVIDNLMELNCSVLGDVSGYETSAIERVFQKDEILSYQDKYLRGKRKNTKGMESTSRELPANIDEELAKKIEKISIEASKVVGASGVLRIDFLYDELAKKLYLNEINTIPGSLAFYLWKAKNIPYHTLIEKLIDIALKTYQVKNSKIYSYESNILALSSNLNNGKLLK